MQNVFYDRNSKQAWKYSTGSGFSRISDIIGSFYINNEFTDYYGFSYKQNKNYQFITGVTGSSPSILSIKLSSPFPGTISETRNINTSNGVSFYTYANPISNENSINIIKYGATQLFQSYLTKSNMKEIDFLINGFREFVYLDKPKDDLVQPNGWCYENDLISEGSYNWYFSTSTTISPSYSTLGSGLVKVVKSLDYIAKLIDYDYFNLEFNFKVTGETTDDVVELYLVNQNDLQSKTNWGDPFRLIKTSGTYSEVSLSATNEDGGKRYLVIRPSMSISARTETYVGSLSNIKIVGGYHPVNNNLLLATYSTTNISLISSYNDMLYKYNTISNGLTYSLSSKIGNGQFKSGIWENGVWNNGWRDDKTSRDFDDIYTSILYAFDVSWEIKIKGSTMSCNSFNVGDKVSIGNIVAIDINENRKLIRDYYTIIDIDKDIIVDGNNITDINWIKVKVNTTFPYRRIERDSPNHKIKITKNIWLSGGFFNGYFSGVWNNGLFKGYTKITEMFNTHWIDGFFNGGHFNSNYPVYNFTDIEKTENCAVGNITLIFGNGHGLLLGDYITITMKNDISKLSNEVLNRITNLSYNGFVKVLRIDGNKVTVNKPFAIQASNIIQSGYVTRYTASGLIQNFNFYDNNISKLKSNQSDISTGIFKFNSWIDVNYDNTRSVTIGRDFKSYDILTKKSTSKNNLFGYPTYDVLSSASRFRNSFDLNYGLYRFGTKYKVYNDFIGESSEFNEPFNEINFEPFYNMSWTYSCDKVDDVKIKSSESVVAPNDILSQNYIDSGVTGEEVWTSVRNTGMVLNNDKVSVNKSRYTIIELDVITHSVVDYRYVFENPEIVDIIDTNPIVSIPILHFSNLNYDITTYVKSIEDYDSVDYSNDYSFDIYNDRLFKKMSFLPVYENISHLEVKNTFRLDSIEKTSEERYNGYGKNQKTKKYEYFYNKSDLMMNVTGNGATGVNNSMMVFDNIKMYEVDMIPFFKYFEYPNINNGIQIPYEGVAPNIDYLNSDFIFVDNISIGLDTINTSIYDNVTPVCVTNTLDYVTVDTIGASVNSNSVTLIGKYDTNNINISNNGFCYIEDTFNRDPLITDSVVSVVYSSLVIKNTNFSFIGNPQLKSDTIYRVRAFVINSSNSADVTYGNVIYFTSPKSSSETTIKFILDDKELVGCKSNPNIGVPQSDIIKFSYSNIPGIIYNFPFSSTERRFVIITADVGRSFVNVDDIIVSITGDGNSISCQKVLMDSNNLKITFTESDWPSTNETITIKVSGKPKSTTNIIDAVDNTLSVNVGNTTTSILSNDTLNGDPVNSTNIILTGIEIPNGFTLNTDTNSGFYGTITISSNVVLGSYTLVYKISDSSNITISDTANVTISVTNDLTIGNQIWQQRNLDVIKYTDGTPIPEVQDATAWSNLTTGAWCYFKNDSSNGPIYGILYNWYAVMGIFNDESIDNYRIRKQLAPIGYHIPSDTEWTTLTESLGGSLANPRVVGGKMKEAGTTHWLSPNTGATNVSKFTALPGGSRRPFNGVFGSIDTWNSTGFEGCWWSTTTTFGAQTGNGYYRAIQYSQDILYRDALNPKSGFSVRCIKD